MPVSRSAQTALSGLLPAKLACVRGLAMTSYVALRWVRALMLASVLVQPWARGTRPPTPFPPNASVLIPLVVATVVAAAPFAGTSIGRARAVALVVAGQGLRTPGFDGDRVIPIGLI